MIYRLIAEWLVLGAAALLALRVATKAPFRRDLRELPRVWVILGLAAGVTVAAAGVVLLVRSAELRLAAAVVSAALIVGAVVRARPGYGRSRGWPSGSLGIAQSLDAIGDRDFYRNQAKRYGPVFKMSQFGRPVVCVLGLERGRALLADHGAALAGASLPYNRALPRGSLRYMEPEAHQQERPLFRQAFGAFDLQSREAAIRRACRRQLDGLVRDAASRAGGVHARPAFERYLLDALSLVFFGLDPEDAHVRSLGALIPRAEIGRMGGRAWRRRLLGALEDATGIMRDIASDAAAGKRSLSGTALGAVLDADPNALEDPTRARNLFLIFRLAHGDVTALLDWTHTMLSRHPSWQDAVRSSERFPGESRSSQPRDLGSRVVLETLRLEQSEFLYRTVIAPIEVDGFRIPKGWLMRILVNESHRDAAIFPSPETFDPDRFLLRTYDKSEFSPFGVGVHGCMGARLTLFLGRVFVEEFCHGYHWEVTQDGPLERGSRHRHHWRPSPRKRIAIHAAAARE